MASKILLAVVAVLLVLPPAVSADGSDDPSPIVKAVRDATAPFRDVNEAIAAGYVGGPCVSGPNGGAMGIHYVNPGLLFDGMLDLAKPEALIYEPRKNGRLRLVGVEYITIAEVWESMNSDPPVLAGQLLHFGGAPNRYRLPAFYELHIWAWRHNPDGTFSDWNKRVTCEEFDPD